LRLPVEDVLLEVGGWLCSDRSSPDYIRLATEPGSDATFARNSGMLGKDVLRDLQATAPHLVPVGDYHLHPTGGSLPSEADRSTWAGNVDLNRLGFNVSIIATPGDSWLSDPKLTAGSRSGKARAWSANGCT
jgi:proteasome lid subunit RPN8/RPN11